MFNYNKHPYFSKDSAEETGAGTGFGYEDHLNPTSLTFRQQGSMVTTFAPCTVSAVFENLCTCSVIVITWPTIYHIGPIQSPQQPLNLHRMHVSAKRGNVSPILDEFISTWRLGFRLTDCETHLCWSMNWIQLSLSIIKS